MHDPPPSPYRRAPYWPSTGSGRRLGSSYHLAPEATNWPHIAACASRLWVDSLAYQRAHTGHFCARVSYRSWRLGYTGRLRAKRAGDQLPATATSYRPRPPPTYGRAPPTLDAPGSRSLATGPPPPARAGPPTAEICGLPASPGRIPVCLDFHRVHTTRKSAANLYRVKTGVGTWTQNGVKENPRRTFSTSDQPGNAPQPPTQRKSTRKITGQTRPGFGRYFNGLQRTVTRRATRRLDLD